AINVNFPACPPEAVKGVAVSVQGRRDAQTAMIDERADGRGIPYYWISFTRGNSIPEHGTDLEALAQNKISVTPLKLDMTDEPAFARLALVLR
ncbi:MAG TPA: 5'/3'-nucleotidase SurE, partial [Methylocella sp.]|nr:5'/3'-nucleotidase SurE [Methylocella sp.]